VIWRGLRFAKENPVEEVRIEDLIKPPVQKFAGFDWSKTEKLRPTGAANRDKVIASRLQPAKDL
jgi:hypothetical protein